MARICTALHLSDQSTCKEEAVSLNGLFCQFHSKLCQDMYKGYKKRNAHLDALVQSPPGYLRNTSVALANKTFEDVKALETLREIRDHLTKRYNLLIRVIGARKLHHTHFFAENFDYGHQHFLDNLQNQKHIVNGALEQVERRTAAVLYENENWFEWVRERQNEEETQREAEKKKIKRDAALWRRHWKQMQERMKVLRSKEDMKKQDEYLEQVYNERLSMEEEENWDPIEDFLEDERGNYLSMIKIFLMRDDEISVGDQATGTVDVDAGSSEPSTTTGAKSKRKKACKKTQKEKEPQPQVKNNMALPETRSQMRQRLREGVKPNHAKGYHIAGTVESPIELREKTARLPDNEIDKLLEEVAEVKQLLLCRILLSHAALLPAAAQAESIDQFLNDKNLDSGHLRDLCLELENPGLQDVRDACADLVRGEDESHTPVDVDISDRRPNSAKKYQTKDWMPSWRRDAGPKTWIPKRELEGRQRRFRQNQMELQANGEGEVEQLHFDIEDDSAVKSERMRVKVCGRYIYNYPSENRMSRGGWLQFCVIAKDSDLFDAIKLCRNWEEFYELNILAVWQYFPAANWLLWVGDQLNLQLLQMGFIPYRSMTKAYETTVHHQTGSRGLERRAHAVLQSRNFIAAHVKRDDQASRRFIRYLSMQSHRVMLLVRDGKTGRILISPPKDYCWLVREKTGFGRASKKSWNIIQEVGNDFFEELESCRKWTFDFNDYYDVIVWDNDPGERYSNVYNTICEMLYKAHRLHHLKDTYKQSAPILKTLTRERDTMRVRDIQPGEEVVNLYDEATDPRNRHVMFDIESSVASGEPLREFEAPAKLFYNENDEAEDRVLFPEEYQEDGADIAVGDELNALAKLEYQGPDMRRFVHDLDTDDELPDSQHRGASDEEDEWEDDDSSAHSGDNSDNSGSELPSTNEKRCDRLLQRFSNEEVEYLGHVAKFPEPSDDPNYDMEGQYRRFLTREMAKTVKEGWHKADLEPGAQARYQLAQELTKKMVIFNRAKRPLAQLSPLAFLNINPYKHRKVIPEMERAFSMMSLFFPFAKEFFPSSSESEERALVDQAERAKNLPVRRYKHSNKTMPKSFWREWDEIKSRPGRMEDKYPAEWDAAIRPIIAHLCKEEILLSSYVPETMTVAIASREPTGTLDLYIDNRVAMPHFKPHAGSIFPPEKEALLKAAQRFAALKADARFAFLRVWSAPHFWPLIVGPDRERREEFTFMDSQGRSWMWKFVPKDTPCSEMSIHMGVHYRIQPFKWLFGEKLILRSDTLLVMGEDEKELLKLASAATYAVQDEPWRLEIDLWKSFVNIDIKTLEGLDVGWLD